MGLRGVPLPVNITRLDREFLPLTPDIRAQFPVSKLGLPIEHALDDAEYFCGFWVTAPPRDAIPAPGFVAVADRPREGRVIDVARWTSQP